MIWNFIKADTFFKEYLPHIKSYKHKIRGKNGRGSPVEFSAAEKKQIKAVLKSLSKDLERSIKQPTTTRYALIDKKYIPLEHGYGIGCDNCGKLIANIATIKNEDGKVVKLKDMNFDFLINTLKNIFPKKNIEVI